MKFIQLLICLIVFTSLFLEIYAITNQNLIQEQRRRKLTKKSKGIIDWLFSDWNDIKLYVNDAVNHQQEFKGKMKHVFFDKEFNVPYGLEFQDLTEESGRSYKNTGFVSNVLVLENLVNQGKKKQPVLDLRFIRDCSFTDNAKDWFGDWIIYFNVQGSENYQKQSSQPFGNNWAVKLVLPAANKEKALGTKAKIEQACVQRSKAVNTLKANAVSTGNNYYTLYDIQRNKDSSLAKKVEQGQSQDKVLKNVQSESALKSSQIQEQINSNQASLQQAIATLSKTQADNNVAKQDVEKYNKDLADVQNALSKVQASQVQVAAQIQATKAQLNDAINLQNSQKQQAQAIADQAAALKAQGASEAAELARLVKEQEDDMARLKAEFEAKQAQNLAQQQAIKSQGVSKQEALSGKVSQNDLANQVVNQALAQSAQTIEGLLLQVQNQEDQAKLIDAQRKSTESSISNIQSILAEKRTVADQLSAMLDLQSAFQAQQDSNLKSAQDEGARILSDMAAKQKAQLDLLDQANAQVKAAQVEAKRAADEVAAAYLAFNNAINAINSNAKTAQVRTQAALEKVSVNQHASELNAIVSNSGRNIARRRARLAKQRKAAKRLAKIQKKQAKKIRLQRLKNKKNRKNSKKGKKSNKKCHGDTCPQKTN